MKHFARILVVVGLIGGIVAAAYRPAAAYWSKRHTPGWRTTDVIRGDIVADVNATGTVKPVLQVRVGSFVSGPIVELNVNFNQEVAEGDLLARIDPRIYTAAVQRDAAQLATRKAEVERVRASLQLATNNETRAKQLRQENRNYVSQAELDQVHFSRLELEAQLKLAEAAVLQAEANLANSQAQLEYTEIRAPVSGVVIDRKIDPGQTLAAQFQTPELFILAPDMRKKMHVYAAVDEADIGMIRSAQQAGRKVQFTVDAYPGELFEGTIEEVRFSSTETQNVVTYPVIVAAANPDLKLLPGMTAGISFEVERRTGILRIPNSALRFLPDARYAREADRQLLSGTAWADDQNEVSERQMSAEEKAEARRTQNKRHVWVADGQFLRAVEVVVGISDNSYTELVSGDLNVGDSLVFGVEPPKGWIF
ncbi:MAG: efflux RND transporter periplasmic adaptor subunit [Pirellulaceae bacterium]